jgi:hypothetical protein
MDNKENSRKYSKRWYGSFDVTDTCYYGVFIKHQNNGSRIQIDPKRYKVFFKITDEMKTVMDKRIGVFFYPAKHDTFDYNVNRMTSDLIKIRREWYFTNKPIINHVLSEINGNTFQPYDNDLFNIRKMNYIVVYMLNIFIKWFRKLRH